MVTVILVVAAVIVLGGVFWMVMQSGAKDKRLGQSGNAAANKQAQNTPRPGQVRTSGSAND
jgi:flagellar basal body-associated protein FliL